jgi:hypothetical protein
MATADNATSSRARRVAADYRDLRETADRCDALAAAVDNSRAHRLLTLLAARARGVLAVIDAEPGLHTYLDRLPYGRAVALLAELIRQAHGRIRTVAQHEAEGRELPQQRRPRLPSNAELWEDAEALTARADELGTAAVHRPPRLHLDTTAGSQALSRRLVDVHQLAKAADTIDTALAAARRLPHPDPAADILTTLTTSLREQITALRTNPGDNDWWTGYFDRQHRDAAAQRAGLLGQLRQSEPGQD